MADISSLTRKYGRLGQGGLVMTFEGIFPASAASATVPVGGLLYEDYVTVSLRDSKASWTVSLIENRSSRTDSTKTATGTLNIGTQDGSSSPSSAWVRGAVWRMVV